MFSQQVSEKYGYGWYVRERGGQWNISRDIRSNKLIIALSNVEDIDLSKLEQDISKILKTAD